MTDTTTPSVQTALQCLERERPAAIERLKQLLAIPSVSTDPAYAGHVRRAAEWVASTLRETGMTAAVLPTAGHPVVLAKSADDAAPADAPRVLFYGHYDVQPADPLELWKTPPFEPTVRDGKIYARGAADDKGQICTFFEALRAWHLVGKGRLPVHVTLLIEGEEESGSAHLRPFLEAHAAELAAPAHDFALISDTTLWEGSAGPVPAITYGLRGLQYFDIQLHGPKRDLHSGVYGGTLANPATILTAVLGRLFDKRQRVAIPGFYDDVLRPTAAEKRRWAKLGFDEKNSWARSAWIRPLAKRASARSSAAGPGQRATSTGFMAATAGRAPRLSSPALPARKYASAWRPIRPRPKSRLVLKRGYEPRMCMAAGGRSRTCMGRTRCWQPRIPRGSVRRPGRARPLPAASPCWCARGRRFPCASISSGCLGWIAC